MNLEQQFATQAEACEALGSPFNARLLRIAITELAPELAVGRRLWSWPQDTMRGDAVALRLAGALHALVLQDRSPELTACYPPNAPSDEALRAAIRQAFVDHSAHILHWLDNAPQTNEPRRSNGILLGAWAAAQQFPNLPFRVSELGASAGLNLHFDRFAVQLGDQTFGSPDPALVLSPDWTGPRPKAQPITIRDRRGVDINPLDITDAQAALRLRSYTWPDQFDRMARLDTLLKLPPAPLDAADAGAWLTERLDQITPGQIDFLYHTVAWQYFPADTDQTCRAAIARRAERATAQTPFAWLSFEMQVPNPNELPGAPLILRLWPGDVQIDLGRMDFHGRWVTHTA